MGNRRHRRGRVYVSGRRLLVATVALTLTGAGATAGIVLPRPSSAATTDQVASPEAPANGYGPGIGPQSPGTHWGGAYTLRNVTGYAYCVQPGGADPLELPGDQWSPAPYPGSGVYSDGEMAALTYFAQRFEGSGYPGWSAADTTAAIAQVAYASAGGATPPASQAPANLVALVQQYIVTYEGPWTMSLSMNPSSGSAFDINTNYQGTITITSATGNGIGGLQLTSPPTGGPGANQVSSFEWLAGTTNAAGQISFQWSISDVPEAFDGLFSAQGIAVVGGGVGAAPPTYAAPNGSGGQLMIVSGATEILDTEFGGLAVQPASGLGQGTITIHKSVPDAAYYGSGGAQYQIETETGTVVDTLTTDGTGNAGPSAPLTATSSGTQYVVHESESPTGYGPAPDQTVTVLPGQNTPVDYVGALEEPARQAQLGAAKIDAQTGQPLAGAVFDFKFDAADDGAFDTDLGTCTTGTSGVCQPPAENTGGGWLPGWYLVTETAAPPGYWLDPSDTGQVVFLDPGATAQASVTFADQPLGSLQLTKTGNDAAYWPVTGAQFTVTGPEPSTAVAGTLTVGDGGATDTLNGLVPGTYAIEETTAPPGYSPAPSFAVAVGAGPTVTTATVFDAVHPGSLTIVKSDQSTNEPLAGATFDVRFDPTGGGQYSADLGSCTTGPAGTCSPPPNATGGLLPGDYLVTEVTAPPGYSLATPPPSRAVTVQPAQRAIASFTDALVVPASFHKVATGDFNPSQVVLAGAVIDVTAGTRYGGTPVAACTTDAGGNCTTVPSLVSGQSYCWMEVRAPAGLQSGATGCFSATNAQGIQPITVSDPGIFVGIDVRKVDAANPNAVLPGAVYDLYRVADTSSGPTPPPGTPAETTQTWEGQSVTEADGIATFPLQLPGYSYCVLEVSAPQNYELDPTEHCTDVLEGSIAAPVTTLTLTDAEARVTVVAHKYNSAAPDTGIPGAVYDLYVEGSGPPSDPSSTPPQGASTEPGDRWWARATTDSNGDLRFSVPAGYAWCLHEVEAPADYLPDSSLHCTAVLGVGSSAAPTTLAIPETLATVYVDAHKYNAADPGTGIPGAVYELLVEGGDPPGYDPPAAPSTADVPMGDTFWAEETTDSRGSLSFAVPAGYRWCLHEQRAPAGYEPDESFHCTALVSTGSPTDATEVALPEMMSPPETTLAFTGGPDLSIAAVGLLLLAVGAVLCLAARRRSRRGRGRRNPLRISSRSPSSDGSMS